MIIKGRAIYRGKVEGKVVKCDASISFLGEVDPKTSKISSGPCAGLELKNSILVFESGKGSTVGSIIIYSLAYYHVAPAAMVLRECDEVVVTGAIMAGIPTIDQINIDLLATGDHIKIEEDQIYLALEPTDIVTGILMCEETVLLLKRSDKVKTYKEKWAGVSGYLEKGRAPKDQSLIEILEETGLADADVLFKRASAPFLYRDGENLWRIHSFLWVTDKAEIKIDWEHTEYRWVELDKIDSYDTVPKLKEVIKKIKED